MVSVAHRILYKGTGGRVGGNVGRAGILLLSTTGRASGRRRTTPVIFMPDGDDFIVVASNGGSDAAPDWWLNLKTDPRASVQLRSRVWPVVAEETTGQRRTSLWDRLVMVHPDFHSYSAQTRRRLPVVRLRLVGARKPAPGND